MNYASQGVSIVNFLASCSIPTDKKINHAVYTMKCHYLKESVVPSFDLRGASCDLRGGASKDLLSGPKLKKPNFSVSSIITIYTHHF